MSLTKSFFFLITGSVIAAAILQFSLTNFATARMTSGCRPLDLSGEIDPTSTVAFWENHPISPLLTSVDTLSKKETAVLGVSSDEKWIEIDLSDQRLKAWQGSSLFLESLISSGLWNKTPPGEYRIWYKIKYTKMEGGVKGQRSYYYLPNVPFAMFFYGDYSIHGTYWHNNFGNRMSHGCVNTPTPVAEQLFYWTDPPLPDGKKWARSTADNPGTRVVVHE